MTKQLVFIASGGRTGTQFFGDILGSVISDCHSEHEPDMFAGVSRLSVQRIRRFGLWHMVCGRLLGKAGVRITGQRFLEGRMTIRECAKQLRRTRQTYHQRLPQSLIIESYYAWWMVADQLEQIWPEAKMAGVIRDPRDWIVSWQRHSKNRRRGTLTERLPPGPLTPGKLGDEGAAQLWPRLDQVGCLAWEWGLICNSFKRAAEHNPNVKIFRFEDIFAPDGIGLQDFVRFASDHDKGPAHDIADLTAVAGVVRNASRGSAPDWHSWSDAQVAAVAHFCQPDMEAFGYGQELDWLARVEAAGSI